MSGWSGFWQVLGLVFGVFLSGSCAAQGWQAVDVTGAVLFSLPQADSLRKMPNGTLLTRENGSWYLRRSRDGEVLAGPLLPEPKTTSFGTLYPTLNGTWIGIPATGGRVVAGTRLDEVGKGWLIDAGPGLRTLYSREGYALSCPAGTDSAHALTSTHLLYRHGRKHGMVRWTGTEGQVALPAVYDSILGPDQGYVLAYDRSLAQLYDESGRPVYKGSFAEARFLNRHWLAGRTTAGWQAVHLPSLKLFSAAEKPKALGLGHCLMPKGAKAQVLDSTGKVVAENLEAALTQTGTDRLVVRRAGKWYLLSEEGAASVLLKTPHLLQMEPFTDGLAPVCTQAGLWGFADGSGFMRIAPRYRGCTAFSLGLAGVQIGASWGLIDKAERLVCQPRCDSVRELTEAGAWVCYGGGTAEIYQKNRAIGRYRDVLPAGANLLVQTATGWGLVKPDAAALVPPWYASLQAVGGGLLLARRGDEWAVLTPSHQNLLPWSRRRILWDSVAGIFFVERPSVSAND